MCYAHFSFRMRVKKLPKILALHLKRFKYMEQLQRYAKLSYRVVFPFELRLFNTVSMSSSACTKSMFLSINKGITSESKIQDKNWSIMHVFMFIYRRKAVRSGLSFSLQRRYKSWCISCPNNPDPSCLSTIHSIKSKLGRFFPHMF